jgi:MATE family multidrug resistance protein
MSTSETNSGPAPAADPARSGSAALWEILRIAAPSVATMTSYTAMQFVDGLMVSRISPADPINLSAQFNGGLIAWVPQSLLAGLLGVVNTFVAQNLGAGRAKEGPSYAWNAVWICVLWWLAVLIPVALVAPLAFRSMGHDPALVDLSSSYAQILLFCALPGLMTRAITQFFYGMHMPMVVLAAAIAGNATNVFGNWVFIYGNLGAPALGVAGAAWGTVLGTVVEAVIPLCVFLGPSLNARFATRGAWRLRVDRIREICRLGWAPALMFGSEMITWAYFVMVLVAPFGKEHNAASAIVLRYMHLSFMPAVGIGNALTAIVGRYLGAGRPDLAQQRAILGIKIAMIYMGICAACILIFREPMVKLFLDSSMDPDETARVISIGVGIMIVAALFQVFDAVGVTLVGVLRGAGDTTWPGVMTLVLSWTVIVGGGHAAVVYAPGLESLGPWIAAAVYIVLFGLLMAYRFFAGPWRSIRLVHTPETAAASLATFASSGSSLESLHDPAAGIDLDERRTTGQR